MALLKFKRSAVPAKVPALNDLALGELAINTYDGKVYTKKDDGTPAIVEIGGNSSGITTITSTDGSVTVTGSGATRDLSVAVAGSTTNVLALVRNNTGATLTKGTVVYINGSLGQNSTVAKAIATSDATSAQTLGLMTANLANNATGYVTIIGLLTNMNTSAFTDGQQLYLSPTTAGTFTATKPYAPNHIVYVAVVEHAHPTQGKLFVKVQNGYEMDELHDVSAQSPSNNHGLFYNTTSGLWENKSIVTALGYTPVNRAGDAFTGPIYFQSPAGNSGFINGTGDGASLSTYNFALQGWNGMAFYNPTVGGAFPNATSGFVDFRNGILSMRGDVRAPIFYDSPDSAYYLDPAGTSNLNAVTVNGNFINYAAGANDGWASLNFRATNEWGDGNLYGILGGLGGRGIMLRRPHVVWNSDQGAADIRLGRSGGPAVGGDWVNFGIKGNNVGFIGVADNNVLTFSGASSRITAVNGVNAPIYYDSPNTAYFADPAGTSNLSGVTLDGTLTGVTGRFAKNQTAGNYTTAALWTESYGNTTTGIAFHISGVVGKFLEMRTDQILYWSGIMNADGEFRAPIFRDMNNSAYFLDPSETSQLKTVEVSGGIGFRAYSNGSASINSQFYFANAANSRAWNWQLDENNDAALWNFNGSSWNKRFTFTAGSNFIAGGNIGANAGIFTNDAFSRVLYLKGAGNIIQFQDADGTDRWENVGRNGTYYVWKGYGTGSGFKWQIDDNGNQIFNGIATFNTEIRTPIFRDSNDTSYYVDPNSVTRLNKLTAGERSLVGYATLSMAGLDANTYYPVTIPVPTARQTTLRIENALNSNVPSWSTHPAGFSCYIEWTTNGLGWGTIPISRRVTDWRESFTSVQIVGGIDQMTFSSQEVIWLRGGANYYFSADCDVTPTIRTTSYDSFGQVVAPRSSIYNNPRETAQGRVAFGSLQTNEQSLFRGNIDISTGSPQIVFTSTTSGRAASFGMTDAYNMYLNAPSNGVLYLSEFRAPMFRDTDNSAYYLDPATGFNFLSTGVTYSSTGSGLFVANAEGTGNTVRLGAAWSRAGSYSNGGYTLGSEAWIAFWISASEKGYIDSSSNLWMNGSVRAPIFYDSVDSTYYINLNGYSQVNGNGSVNGSAGVGMSIYSADNNGAIMSFHRGGYYAVNMGLDNDNVIRIGGWSAAANRLQMDMSGNLTMAGNVTAYSDARLKEDVATVSNALELVGKMRGVTYTRKDTGEAGVGVIAQEMLEVMPEVVQQGIGNDDTLSVAYGNLVGVLIEAIKELSLKVKTLEEKDN